MEGAAVEGDRDITMVWGFANGAFSRFCTSLALHQEGSLIESFSTGATSYSNRLSPRSLVCRVVQLRLDERRAGTLLSQPACELRV